MFETQFIHFVNILHYSLSLNSLGTTIDALLFVSAMGIVFMPLDLLILSTTKSKKKIKTI